MGNEEVSLSVVDALTIANVGTVAEAAAFALASTYQDSTDFARRSELLAEAHLGKYLHQAVTIDPVAAVATSFLFRGAADSNILSTQAQLVAGQQGAKIAMSTPPESGVTGQLAQMMALVAITKSAFGAIKPAVKK